MMMGAMLRGEIWCRKGWVMVGKGRGGSKEHELRERIGGSRGNCLLVVGAYLACVISGGKVDTRATTACRWDDPTLVRSSTRP